MQRHTSLDVYDFTGHALCNLYDSTNDVSGQATDVIISTKRNGFKEIKFSIPSTCFTEEGEVKNYRLDFLVNDYRLRFYDKDSDYTDWFLISESKVTHNEFSMQYDVRASHISQLLNTKNLNLEFSNEEGNNTGTIGQIAETILEGTGWHLNEVHFFEEEEKFNKGNVEKVRSFTAPAKTGAFKMMSDLCEMFDAKPIYHGEGTYVEDGVVKKGRTVDIVPINPFSEEFEQGTVPPDLNDNQIIELHYDKNVSNVTRTLDSDSLVSVLYAYGSYGDRNGLASLQKADHAVITFGSITQGNYKFSYKDAQYYFTVDRTVSGLKWSSLDFTSRSYLYNGTDFFKVSKNPEENVVYTKINITSEMISYEKNQVPNLLDFTYYQKIGMLTDEQLLKIAEVQSELPALHVAAEEAALDLAEIKNQLFATASDGNGFLKLDIDSSDKPYNYVRLTLKKTTYPDGVIYRSDYDEAKRNYFSWTPAKGFKNSGEAIAAQGSVVYIVLPQSGSVATRWQKSYVKSIGNGTDDYYRDSLDNTYMLHVEIHKDHKDPQETGTYFPAQGVENTIYVADDTKKTYIWKDNDYVEIFASSYDYALNEFPEPTTITLWTETTYWANYSSVYLFSADAIAGLLGPKEEEVESNKKAIEKAVKVDTEVHPMYFIQYTDPVPSVDACRNGYGWYYANDQVNMNHTMGRLYFCYGKDGEDTWSRVSMYEGTYAVEGLGYLDPFNYIYSLRNFMLYRWETDSYKPFNRNTKEKAITNAFAAVVEGWNKHERLVRGVHEVYTYSDTNTPIEEGTNCAFKDPYNNYCLFTTTKDIDDPSVIRYTPGDKIVWQDNNESNIIKGMERHSRYLEFPKRNELTPFTLKGSYNSETHAITYGGALYISNNITVKPNVQYDFNLPSGFIMVCFDTNHRFVSEVTSGASYVMPNHVTQIQIITEHQITSSHYLRVHNYDKVLFSKDILYNIFSFTGSGERKGLFYLMKEFTRLSDSAYLTSLPALKQAQQAITDKNNELANELGDMYREGYWQENDYTESDENKLYIDALDNLKEISHPLATYEVSYLDLNESEEINNETIVSLPYPDIDINYAAHLIDTDIDTNKWAYIDSIDKCYDKPWKTQIEINTQLSTIGQQSFTDVMAKIAEVANETKAKQTIYSKAAAIGRAGQFAADKLEGLIKANKLYILGGTSNWYTDNKGNIVFEDTDGNSAMMLTGRGLMISNSKDIYGDWEWRTALSGQGFNCDVIATGEFSAKHITAGTITTDKLSSAVGQELEIGSNKALLLYATVDGLRPAGSVETTDSLIEIKAADGNDPAQINVLSGGEINLRAGTSENPGAKLNIESYGQLNLSGSTLNLTSSGKININAGTTLDIKANSEFLVDSENFKITKVGNAYNVEVKGKITAESGKIAGFNIGTRTVSSNTISYLYSGNNQSMSGTSTGVYLGEDGINIANKLKFSADGNTATFSVNASDIILGDVTGFSTLGSKLTDMDTKTGTAQSAVDNIANGTTSVPYVNASGISIQNGVITVGATGSINMAANSSLTFATSSSNSAFVLDANGVSIGSAKNITLVSGGTITIGAVGHAFDIGFNSNRAWIRNGVTYVGDPDHNGVYVGTDGIQLGQKVFSVNAAGTLIAKDGNIAGWTFDDTGRFHRESYAQGSQTYTNGVGMCTSGGSAFYAGMTSEMTARSQSPWSVSFDGTMYARNAYIKGEIKATSLYIGATSDSNGTLLKVDTNGLVLKNSSTAKTAVLDTAGITVNPTTGVVISSASGDASKVADTMNKIAAITLSGTKIDPSSLTTAAANAITKASNISVTNGRIDLSSLSTSVVTQSGLTTTLANYATIAVCPYSISALTFDSLGSASSVQITPTSITVGSSGSINLSAANVTLNYSQLSNKPNLFTVPTGMTIADKELKVYSGNSNYIHIVAKNTSGQNGIYAKGTEIKLDAASGTNHVYITSSGIDIKGERITINDKAVWARDDIIIGDTEPSNHPTGDWVWIKPYYNATVVFDKSNQTTMDSAVALTRDSNQSFGDDATGFAYKVRLEFSIQGQKPGTELAIYSVLGGITRKMDPSHFTCSNSSVSSSSDSGYDWHIPTSVDSSSGSNSVVYEITFNSRSSGGTYNLAGEGFIMYAKVYWRLQTQSANNARLNRISVTATCNASTSKVPCTVYYYPNN